MKKILIVPAGLLALTLLISSDAFAYKGDPKVQGPNYSAERHSQMTEAFENKDYDAWKNLMSDRGQSRVLEIITEENFDTFTQIHNLMLEGKIEEAQELRQELGLGQKNGMGKRGNGSRDGSGFGRNR